MKFAVNSQAILPICAAVFTAVGALVVVPAQADGGCIPGDQAGMVPRNARAGDNVCVPQSIADLVQTENANKDAGYAGGGPYGPLTCINGLVWREAFDGDGICVTPARRTETWQQNANAGVGATGGLTPQTPPPAGNPGGGNPPPPGGEPVGGDQGGAVLSQINAKRAANGCGPVAANPQLTAAAARHANDMLKSGVEGHTGSDGSSDVDRITAAGYTPYTKLGEIVYWGTGSGGTPDAAVTWWMNSPGHRAIITDCEMTDAGFSAVSNGNKMTAAGDFGKQ